MAAKEISPEEREKRRKRSLDHYYSNRERLIASVRAWQRNNPERHKLNKARAKKRYLSTPQGRVTHSMRVLIQKALKKQGHRKQSRTQEILGCDMEFFKRHIERQFLPGMTWEKVGPEIHIDHIIPASTAQTEEDALRLNHFTNFRPMWAGDNIRKSDTVTHLL